MSDSILMKVFGVEEGYKLVRTEYEGDFLRLHLEIKDSQLICPQCASDQVSRKGRRYRELKTVPIGLMPVYLWTEVPDCQCRKCGRRFEVSPPLPPPIAASPIDWWNSCKPSPN